jgi:hypothetical protein
MKVETLVYSAAAVICAGWLLCPESTQAARHGFNLNLSSNAESCADLKVTSNDGQVAKLVDTFTMTRAEASVIELNGDGASIHVRGWDRPNYSVETCKVAVAETSAEADRMAKAISVSHAGGKLSFSGPPASDSGQWTAVFLIHAPKDAGVDLETRNSPIDVREMNGAVKVRASNGPLSIRDCGGTVEAHTTNGPISFAGERGEVHLNAKNGPISLKLASDSWNGSALEARTINGPLSVSVPENFRTGMRLETAGHAPLSCSAAPCRNAFTDATRSGRMLRMNGASDTIRLSTENGPVSIAAAKK